jgi:SynChlorMet cassette protein ScmC
MLQYGLRLAQGDSWSLYFSSETMLFGRDLVKILGLKEDTQSHQHKIFFCTGQEARFNEYLKSIVPSGDIDRCDTSYISFPGLEIRYYPSTASYLCIPLFANHENRSLRYISMMSALYPLYQKTIKSGGLVLHAALLHHPDIGGIAILGPGGTGKSTCVQRAPSPWSPYADDLILVVRDPQSIYYAHPLPTWSNLILGRSQAPLWPIERYSELQGLFFLHKADRDHVIPLPQPDAVQWIYESSIQVYQGFIDNVSREAQLEQKSMIFSNACNLARQCPSFILKAMYSGYFWVEIEKVIQRN